MTLHVGAEANEYAISQNDLSCQIGQVMKGQEDANSRRVMPIVPDWIPRTPFDYLLPHLSLLLLPLSTALSNPVNVWNR
jgi:hypothetical protein